MAAAAACFYGARILLKDCDKDKCQELLDWGNAKTDWTYIYVLPCPEIYAHQWSDDNVFERLPEPPTGESLREVKKIVKDISLNAKVEVDYDFWLTCDR